jgi:hypothetical protein
VKIGGIIMISNNSQSNCRVIHETVVKDIVDIAFDASTKLKDTKLLSQRDSLSTSSLMKLTNNLVLVFPVIISRSIDIETAQMITKAIERKAVTMLQIAFTAINYADAEDAFKYVKQFHQNINFSQIDSMQFDEYQTMVSNALNMVKTIGGNNETAIMYKEAYNLLKEDMKNINYVLDESISNQGLDEYYLDLSNYSPILEKKTYRIKDPIDSLEIPDRTDNVYNKTIQDADGNDKTLFDKNAFTADMEKYKQTAAKYNNIKSNKLRQEDINFKKSEASYNREQRQKELEFNVNKMAADAEQNNADKERQKMLDDRRYALDKNSLYQKMLIDTDVKKANEIIPTMMIVNFTQLVRTGEEVNKVPTAVVIGIKAKMYPVDSTDIINRVSNKNKDRKFFLNFIRATTREISFVKDFILGIEKAKADAISFCKTGNSSKIWKILERRTSKSKAKRVLGSKNDAMSISTLVMSQDEVESLRKNYEFDILKSVNARMILQEYNLIGLVVADSVLETLNIIWDTGTDDFETLSFNTLERDVADNSSKKVVNLLAKVAK